MGNKISVLCLGISVILSSFTFGQDKSTQTYSLSDFLSENKSLDSRVEEVFNSLNDTSKIAQLLMPAIGKYGQTEATIDHLVKNKLIGGVLLLNGTREQYKAWTSKYNGMNVENGALPFLYSADAEPSLVNRKMIGSTPVKKANELTSEEDVVKVAQQISADLNEVGVNYNFAPVVDMSSNGTVGYRGFGKDPANIVPWSSAFIDVTQKEQIIATAKHFPGHGLVTGDTHKTLQVIDGELKELKYYPPLIENGVLSIMIGHLAVKNNPVYNTNGYPATTSHKIVTELLRDSLNFKGLIVTDAMNMGGVVKVDQANVLAVKAGCDIVLMPLDAEKAHGEILAVYKSDKVAQNQIDESVKRIIRMKICLGLIE